MATARRVCLIPLLLAALLAPRTQRIEARLGSTVRQDRSSPELELLHEHYQASAWYGCEEQGPLRMGSSISSPADRTQVVLRSLFRRFTVEVY